MKASAPQMRASLKASGVLPAVIQERARLAETTYSLMYDQAIDQMHKSTKPPQEAMSDLLLARTEAARIALDQAVEFETSEPAEEPISEPQQAA